METSKKSKIAGILTIITGGLSIIGAIAAVVSSVVMAYFTFGMPEEPLTVVQALVYAALFLLACGILAIMGGIFALRRREWWLALTGAICAVLVCAPTGIPALILITLAKDEFK